MKTLWAGAFAVVLSTAVYAKVADTVVDMPKFEALAKIYNLSSPQAFVTDASKPQVHEALIRYLQLHHTRLEDPQQVWLADQGRH